MNTDTLTAVILYVRDLDAVAHFYQQHFGFVPGPATEAGWRELVAPDGGCTIALHRAAKSQKRGSEIKLVFAVRDVAAFRTKALRKGLKFGAVLDGPGFRFANAKDPAGNSISVSSRPFRKSAGAPLTGAPAAS
jgi:predicted enzyme related to lactoylglutathione lyase